MITWYMYRTYRARITNSIVDIIKSCCGHVSGIGAVLTDLYRLHARRYTGPTCQHRGAWTLPRACCSVSTVHVDSARWRHRRAARTTGDKGDFPVRVWHCRGGALSDRQADHPRGYASCPVDVPTDSSTTDRLLTTNWHRAAKPDSVYVPWSAQTTSAVTLPPNARVPPRRPADSAT